MTWQLLLNGFPAFFSLFQPFHVHPPEALAVAATSAQGQGVPGQRWAVRPVTGGTGTTQFPQARW